MSRVFEALRQFETEARPNDPPVPVLPDSPLPPPPAMDNSAQKSQLEKVQTITVVPRESAFLLSLSDERGLGAEKFRMLATRLSNIRRDLPLKVLEITSSIVGEGKTLISTNLAITLAKHSGENVLLIEGDLRRPAVCPMFDLESQPGLGQWWKEQNSSILRVMRKMKDLSFYLLPAGSVAHPIAMLQSGRLAEAMKELRTMFDWIVIDTPPLLPMADSNLWARLSDATLLVIREGVVPRRAVQQAVESMDSPKLVGLVLNGASDFDHVDYYDRYYYGYGSSKHDKKSKKKVSRYLSAKSEVANKK